MFKLFKDLTRPPEPLSPRPHADTSPISTPYAARQPRNGASTTAPGAPGANPSATAATAVPAKVVEVDETDENAKTVVELLHKLEAGGDMMHYVETLSQIHAVPQSKQATRAFKRHKGFPTLIQVFKDGLAWKPRGQDEGEEWEVKEVQRMEGVRIGLETLGWALGDYENRKTFDSVGGYLGLLPLIRALAPLPQQETNAFQDPSSSSRPTTPFEPRPVADSRVFLHLLAHILNDNYIILSLLSPSNNALEELSDEKLKEKLGDLTVKRPAALPLLWAYLWGLEDVSADNKSKGKAKERPRTEEERMLQAGELESETDPSLLRLGLGILALAAQSSTANLFAVRYHLPDLPEFLMTRLYGYPAERKYEITFPARDDWCDDLPEDDEVAWSRSWTAPSDELRSVYLALFRRILEAGITQQIVWRLFNLAKVSANALNADGTLSTSLGATPSDSLVTTPGLEDATPKSTPQAARKRPRPSLHISTLLKAPEDERLRPEVLDLIRHAMKARWPPAFVFRGGSGENEGGLELKDMGKMWPSGTKGFNFSAWIHVSKLNRPITLIHASQASQPHALFRVRILENSQIAILSTIHKPATAPPADGSAAAADDAEAEEVICAAPDALIAHHTWTHFAVGLRKIKASDSAEVRVFVNGVRVGAMRVPYPVGAPLPPHPIAPQAKPSVAVDCVRLSVGRDWNDGKAKPQQSFGKQEENEWMLGRMLLLEEAVPEDLVLLMYHLGPRYTGNLQEALGKFLTYEGATSINVYLSNLAANATDKKLFTSPAHSILVRAIRQGPAISEDAILLSLSAKDFVVMEDGPDVCHNAGVPHPYRAKQVKHGMAHLVGNVEVYSAMALDESVACVGGGTVILKMIDLSASTEELAVTLGLMRDMIKDSWSASEEMERIRGFEMLAAILRPKMPTMVDAVCTKVILSMLGINMDKPNTATVHNSAAYRALGLEFELWSHASLGVVTLYLQHFENLLSASKHARYNVLRTFQKAAMVRKMLYALRSGYFDLEVVPVVVDILRLALLARWSGEDAIKPVFSYLVAALCQGFGSFSALLPTDPPASQVPAAQILAMIAELCAQPVRLVKLTKALALHRLLIIFMSSNSAFYVIVPCLSILERCLGTPGLDSFQRSFEAEGGFALLARTLGSCWRDDVQGHVFRMMVGDSSEKDSSTLACTQLVSTVLAALDYLLQASGEEESRPMPARTRSGTITSMRSVALTPINTDVPNPDDDLEISRLESLLNELTATYSKSQAFRRCITGRKLEQLLPSLAEFAAVSASSSRPETARSQRGAAAVFLEAVVAQSKIPNNLLTQATLIIEQLRVSSASPRLSSSSFALSPASPRPGSSYFGSSLSGRLSQTPPASPGLGSSVGGFPRRRPSTEYGAMMGMGFPARSRSIKEQRAPLKRVLTGESILDGGKDKNAAWKLIIIQTDAQSHSKMTLERKDHWQRLSDVDWPRLAAGLRLENGLWPDEAGPVTWRLDGSEGPIRMRNRLERINAAPENGAQRTRSKLRDAIPSVDELSSAVSRINTAPWEDPFALALGQAAPIAEEESPLASQVPPSQAPSIDQTDQGDDESYVEIEENKDDKMRRITRTLQAGDIVEEAHNIVRIVGVDACPGLLILGKKNLYLVDGLVQTAEGEVIDAKDAPRDVLSVPGTLADLNADEQESHRWSYNEVVENNKRAFLFRDVALELYFSDKRNFLIVFKDKRERQRVVSKLTYKADQAGGVSKSIVGNFVLDQVARAIDRSEQQLEAITRKWQNREISNFAYLMLLNQHANRTPNDVTQYPVFPWVLADYNSQILDLGRVSTYRDLTLPMGALTPARKEAATERYSATEGVGEQPFHYGTHYSSSMIVCGFMIRLSPFTEIFLALQGGNFDLADRLFSSIPRAWDSASADNRGDVRELVPEFYYSPAFLRNMNHHDFGRKQISGDSVDNVVLPPWALDDPLLFVHRHREALESDFVSRHLHSWIDLTFGYKQRDPNSFNCFHPLSYRGAVDLESISDESERAASTAIIHNFGQTPLQIFKTAHPHRFVTGKSQLPTSQRFGVAEQWQLLIRSALPIYETANEIADLVEPHTPESRPVTQMRERLTVPGSSLSVQYGFADGSLRVYYQEMSISVPRLVFLLEGISVRHAIFATSTLLVTVSNQGVITAWKLAVKGVGHKRGEVSLTREATLRGHETTVTTVTASSAWSLLVSGTEDGKAIVWDTNRMKYIRTLETPHGEPLLFSAINETDGLIALASKHHLYLFSLNGHPIASVTPEGDLLAEFTFGFPETPIEAPESDPLEFTGGISFLKRDFLKFGTLFVIGINNEVALYRCVPGARRFEDEDVKPWKLVEQGRLSRSGDHDYGKCCMVKFIGETLYAAFMPNEANKKSKWALYQWSMPEGDARHVPDTLANSCMAEKCGRHFGLLDPKRHCGGCGGVFCGTHAVHVESFDKRYCESCRAQLAEASALGKIQNRLDSAYPSSRRGSISFGGGSAPGSRRPSISGPGSGTRSTSRSASRVGSRSASRAGSRRPSLSAGSSAFSGIGSSTGGAKAMEHSPLVPRTSKEGSAGP